MENVISLASEGSCIEDYFKEEIPNFWDEKAVAMKMNQKLDIDGWKIRVTDHLGKEVYLKIIVMETEVYPINLRQVQQMITL